MVMAQSLFKALKHRNGDQSIDVVAPAWSLPLLSRMPEVREGIILPVGHGELKLKERIKLGRALSKRRYTKAIVLPRSLKAALVPWFAKIPHRIGYRGEMRYGLINDMRSLDEKALTQTVQRFVALGQLPGEEPPPRLYFPQLVVLEENQRRLVASFGLSLDRPVVALLPGAEYGPAKQWPVEYFADLSRKLGACGAQCWVFGSDKERHLGEAIATQSDGVAHNLCGKTRLAEVIDLLAVSRLAVTNDSGLMHVAAAVSVPLIALFGSSSPECTPPLSETATIVYLDLECSPCFARTCRLGHTNCLNHIEPSLVLTHAKPYVQ